MGTDTTVQQQQQQTEASAPAAANRPREGNNVHTPTRAPSLPMMAAPHVVEADAEARSLAARAALVRTLRDLEEKAARYFSPDATRDDEEAYAAALAAHADAIRELSLARAGAYLAEPLPPRLDILRT